MKYWITYLRATLAAFCWGITFVWYKTAFEAYGPYEVVTLRLFLAAAILFIIMAFDRDSMKLQKGDVFKMMVVAFFEPFLYFNGEANGMLYVSSSVGSIIIAVIPIFAAIGAWLFLKENLSLGVMLGVVLSTIGVIVLTVGSGDFRSTFKGVVYLIFAVFAAIGYSLTVRPMTLKYKTLAIVGYQSLFGFLFFLPIFLIRDSRHFFTMQHPPEALMTVIAMSLFASIFAFILYTDVIRKLGVAKTNIFTNLIPVFTVILAAIIHKDRIDLKTLGGLLLVLCGLFLSQINPERLRFKKAKANP